jgi:signal transduction histidine kinase
VGFVSFVTTRLRDSSARGDDSEQGAGIRPFDDQLLAERSRIAQELHDTLLQGFFAASMHLHSAVTDLPADCPAKAKFDHALRLVDRTLEQGRCAVEGLRLPTGCVASLGEALAGVPTDLCLPPSVGFRVVVHGKERKLKAGLFEDVYRIGREAIFNAYRHSRAKSIEAEIEYRPTELRIAIRDNGRGIDARELHRLNSGHRGLRGMRERAERIGARLRLLSKVALGTEVELCVPNRVAFEQNAPSR